MTLNDTPLESARIRHAFDRAAQSYDQAAALQRRAADRLIRRIAGTPNRILDAGCGTGYATALLRAQFPASTLFALDLAPGMLHATQARLGQLPLICADMQQLPCRTRSLDLLFSNLMLQWCNDTANAFREAARCLSDNGQCVISTFGPRTLRELRESFADAHPHVSTFPSSTVLAAQLRDAGFTQIECSEREEVLYYPTVRALMDELRAIGAGNAAQGRARGLTGKQTWRTMLARYEKLITDKGLPATYCLIDISARK